MVLVCALLSQWPEFSKPCFYLRTNNDIQVSWIANTGSSGETHTSSNLVSSDCFSSWSSRRFSASNLVLYCIHSKEPKKFKEKWDAQNITTWSIILQNKCVELPKWWSMRHSQQSNVELSGIFHHHALDFCWHQWCRFIQDGVLQINKLISWVCFRKRNIYPRFVIKQSCPCNLLLITPTQCLSPLLLDIPSAFTINYMIHLHNRKNP